jgi:dienelactone hydrolase
MRHWCVATAVGFVAALGASSVEAADKTLLYPHAAYSREELGSGARSYWLFEPAQPRAERAPVVVFHHGWLAVNPGVYGAWIEHLTRQGFIVIFPRYHADWTTPPAEYLPNSIAAVRDALDVLQGAPGHTRPDRDRFAIIGHSAGGNLSVLMAAVAAEVGLPQPKAVVSLMPGEVRPVDEPKLEKVPGKTLLVVVAGENDWVVGDSRARQIYAETTAVAPSHKTYILYRSDRQGPVSLVADHLAPTGAAPDIDSGEGPMRAFQMKHAGVDVLDRYGLWRITDITIDAAFAGRTLDEASHGGALFRDLGRWSDGRAVTPPIVGNDLAAIPRVVPNNGARLLPRTPDDFLRTLVADPARPFLMTGQRRNSDSSSERELK